MTAELFYEMIAQLPDSDRADINACVEEITNTLVRYGKNGSIALIKIGLDLQQIKRGEA